MLRTPKEWIIPANPKFYDSVMLLMVQMRFAGSRVLVSRLEISSTYMLQCRYLQFFINVKSWKQGFHGTIRMVLTLNSLMIIKFQKRYTPDKFTFTVLKEEYGIYAVRELRGVPNSLSQALKK